MDADGCDGEGCKGGTVGILIDGMVEMHAIIRCVAARKVKKREWERPSWGQTMLCEGIDSSALKSITSQNNRNIHVDRQ